jgi:hypothetical protein
LNQLILTALEEKYECITLVSVDKSTIITRPGDSFVDDTTTGTADDDVTKHPVPIDERELTSDEEAIVKRMEDIIQFFLDTRKMRLVSHFKSMEEIRTNIASKQDYT